VSSPGAGFLRVAYFPAGRARDTAPAVSRLSLALCAGSRDVGIDRDPVTTPVALQGRRSARHRRVTPREPCHELKHPGIDDLQSSSFAGLTAGGVECNSTIPGEGTIPWYVPYFTPWYVPYFMSPCGSGLWPRWPGTPHAMPHRGGKPLPPDQPKPATIHTPRGRRLAELGRSVNLITRVDTQGLPTTVDK
jgi:hypothetical protein